VGQHLRIGYFGLPGSFSHGAARRRFGTSEDISYQPFPSIEDAFEALAKGMRLIVVPIENASSGMITDTVDQLIQRKEEKAFAVRECLSMSIRLVLLAKEKEVAPVHIYSHNAALTHARSWLKQEYPQAAIIATESTSQAAQCVLDDQAKGLCAAALGSRDAAGEYGLVVARDDVQLTVANRTKFYVIGEKKLVLPDGKPATHTSVLFEAAHQPGSLVAALTVLSAHGLNLTMIQSRPIPGRFDEYRFFIEFNGTPEGEKGRLALEELGRRTHRLDVLGSYPIVDFS
jgi:chorismate mutase/prephenate dehydratase